MTPHATVSGTATATATGRVSASGAEPRAITEIGPTTGAISIPAVPGLTFVSADGTWGRTAS